jgi:hypothetical protein
VPELKFDGLPRYGFLLAAMIAELTLGPLIVMGTNSVVIVRVIGGVVLLAALVVAGSRGVPVILFTAALVSHVVSSFSPRTDLAAAAEAARLVFLCYVLLIVVRHVVRHRVITFDTVAGAACAYMLIGWVWGELFMLVERWRPGSFVIPSSWVTGPGGDMRAALMYFSFATLTTVGYGDIHPSNPASGVLCASEALIGQLYLAIMIARMVGLQISQRNA